MIPFFILDRLIMGKLIRILFVTCALLLSSGPVFSKSLNAILKQTSFVVHGPSGDGTGFAIGQKHGFIYFLTAAHVVGSVNGESEVAISGSRFEPVEIVKRFPGKDIVLAKFRFEGSSILSLVVNKFLPYPAPATPESSGFVDLRSAVDTVTNKAIVSGFSLPTSAIKISVHRVVDSEIIEQIEGNVDGYDLLYQASTIPGMSGGPVVGFRDCSNGGGFALGISPASVFPVLLAVHGRSEGYRDQGRSGISLGVPIAGDVTDYLSANAAYYGIRVGENAIRDYVNGHFCLGGVSLQDLIKRQSPSQATPGFGF